jgi:hypothetical protein
MALMKSNILLSHRIGDVVFERDNSVEFIILDYIYDNIIV